jgi:hypothetical protein
MLPRHLAATGILFHYVIEEQTASCLRFFRYAAPPLLPRRRYAASRLPEAASNPRRYVTRDAPQRAPKVPPGCRFLQAYQRRRHYRCRRSASHTLAPLSPHEYSSTDGGGASRETRWHIKRAPACKPSEEAHIRPNTVAIVHATIEVVLPAATIFTTAHDIRHGNFADTRPPAARRYERSD